MQTRGPHRGVEGAAPPESMGSRTVRKPKVVRNEDAITSETVKNKVSPEAVLCRL